MKALQQRLERELSDCLRQIEAAGGRTTVEDPDDAHTAADPVDRIQATGMARNQLAIMTRVAARAKAIRAALARVADGRYGICVECGEPIGVARLKAVPEVATCVGCQEQLEQVGGHRRVA